MIIDSSAVIAVLAGEPEARAFAELISNRGGRISAATWLECAIVADRRSGMREAFDRFFSHPGIEIVPVTAEHAQAARNAYRRYGKGTGAKAQLNFGDCFAYALAASEMDELLFKGDDFAETDLLPAIT